MKDTVIQKKAVVHPFVYISDSVQTETIKMLILLFLQLVLLCISKSFKALIVIFIAALASVLSDFISRKLFERKKNRNFPILVSILHGIITGMLIPEAYPPVVVFFVTLFTMLIIKYFFGGDSHAWANPAVVTVVVLWIVGASAFPSWQISMGILSMRNASLVLIENGVFPILSFDEQITDFLNSSIFNLFKVSIPSGYVSLFWDTHSVIPAFRFNILTLVSSLLLFSENYRKTIIPFTFVALYALLVRFVSPFFTSGVLYQGDVILCLLTGGTLFCATFVLNWYGTVPVSISGRILYGVMAGITAFFIAGPGTSPSGLVFSILIANIYSIVIQQWENSRDRIKLRKKLENLRKIQNLENQALTEERT